MGDEIARSADQLREQVDIERKAGREGKALRASRRMWLSRAEQKVVKAHAPDLCDICRGTLRTGPSFYDGTTHTQEGAWAWMCSVCFEENGVGLGTGIGQQYNSKTNEKEAG